MYNNELKIMVPKGWSVNEEVMTDGSRVLAIKPDIITADDTTRHLRECILKKVPASELSLADEFLKHQPKTYKEQKFKVMVEKAIKSGLKDFWRPVCDPAFDNSGGICFEHGKIPAVGKSYYWWRKKAKDFWPERGSRLGTKTEYIAFLAVLIKELVASGKSIEWAWDAVCNDSNELGHYYNSESRNVFEYTGSREICGFFDLGNTHKILTEDEEAGGLWSACGNFFDSPLAVLCHCNDRNFDRYDSCGWLVLTEDVADQ